MIEHGVRRVVRGVHTYNTPESQDLAWLPPGTIGPGRAELQANGSRGSVITLRPSSRFPLQRSVREARTPGVGSN